MTFTIPMWLIAVLLIIGSAIVGGGFVFAAINDNEYLGIGCIVAFLLLIFAGIYSSP